MKESPKPYAALLCVCVLCVYEYAHTRIHTCAHIRTHTCAHAACKQACPRPRTPARLCSCAPPLRAPRATAEQRSHRGKGALQPVPTCPVPCSAAMGCKSRRLEARHHLRAHPVDLDGRARWTGQVGLAVSAARCMWQVGLAPSPAHIHTHKCTHTHTHTLQAPGMAVGASLTSLLEICLQVGVCLFCSYACTWGRVRARECVHAPFCARACV